MERLKHIKEALLSCVESQMGDLKNVDAKELGEAVDMIKDMEEAMYYCSITKAMKEREEEEKYSKHQQKQMPMMPMYMPSDYRDMDRERGRMYYGERGTDSRDGSMYRGERTESERRGDMKAGGDYRTTRDTYPAEIRDVREGKSPISRKNYMESKELHHGTSVQMKELEKYLHELSEDITEMISNASPEEKQMLQQKLSILVSKIK